MAEEVARGLLAKARLTEGELELMVIRAIDPTHCMVPATLRLVMHFLARRLSDNAIMFG